MSAQRACGCFLFVSPRESHIALCPMHAAAPETYAVMKELADLLEAFSPRLALNTAVMRARDIIDNVEGR